MNLSSARVEMLLSPATIPGNPLSLVAKDAVVGHSEETARITWRKAGMTSNHHAPYDLGYTRTTMA